MSDDTSLEDRLTTAIVNTGDYKDKARELSEQAESIGTEYQQDLPLHSGNWSSDAVNSYLNNLETTINEPRISQSRQALEDLGFDDDQINTIPQEKLEKKSKVTDIKDKYDELIDEFGEEIVGFLIKNGTLLDWIRNDDLEDVKDRIDVADDQQIDQLDSLDNLPTDIVRLYFRGYLDGSRSVTSAQDLDQRIEYINKLKIDSSYNGGFERYKDNIEDIYNYSTTLENEFGYPKDDIREWVAGESLEDARQILQEKHDEAGTRRSELRSRIKEYCDLLDEEPPDEDAIPALIEHRDKLEERLAEELGETGEMLLRYLQGADEAEVPDDVDRDELIQGIKAIRPVIAEQLNKDND